MPPKQQRPPNGVEFPKDKETGERSTTGVNKEAIARAVDTIDTNLAKEIRAEKKWRGRYHKYVNKLVAASLKSPEAAITSAKDGLKYIHDTMEFVRGDTSKPLSQVMKETDKDAVIYETGFLQGGVEKGQGQKEIMVPYNGQELRGDALKQQIEKWVRGGQIELSCGMAMTRVIDNPKWLDLSDKYFVLLGATSAMGPLLFLMALGANVIAIDLDRKPIWDKLIKTTKESPGTLTFPMKVKQTSSMSEDELAKESGCDLLGQTPEIRNWLRSLKKPLIIGSYAYLDGPLFVKLAVAMDAIAQDLIKDGCVETMAYLCTPTDAHVRPAAAKAASIANYNSAPWWHGILRLAFRGGLTRNTGQKVELRNAQGGVQDTFEIVDAIVPQQGPNYILAKRLQHWRAVVAREAGVRVSTNIAPSTSTASVVSNRAFALAYKGMHYFKPMEVANQELSNNVMGTLLIHDVRSQDSVANPKTPLRNPLELFTENSFHGGAWRCGYKFGVIGVPSAISYLVSQLITLYLLCYNIAQTLGWGTVLATGVSTYVASGGDWTAGWEAVRGNLWFFQHLALLEVAHAALGMVRSGPLSTAVQILSRCMVLQVLDYAKADVGIGFWTFLFAWSVTEVVRYSFYGLGLLKMKVWLITFLRYTLFLVLYPAGVTGELLTLAACAPALASLPPSDASVIIRDLAYPLVGLGGMKTVYAVYAVGLPALYMMMLAGRKGALAPKTPRGKGEHSGGKQKSQ